MAKRESGAARQRRIQREQHRPEQNRGYDEAVNGGPVTANSLTAIDQVPPVPPDERPAQDAADIDDREAAAAAADVRRQDRSAD
jgi:hypothetical protein